MRRFVLTIGLIGLLLITAAGATAAGAAAADDPGPDSVWYPESESGTRDVAFLFVYSETCGYCAKAKPFVDHLEESHDWLRVTRISTENATEEQVDLVLTLAGELGREITGVPTFLYCERMDSGFEAIDTTGADLERRVVACHDALGGADGTPIDDEELSVPVLGEIDAQAVSLPLFTVAIAGLDAFNPCAFFVLLFLLSLLVHARSRWRMALVGGVFVLVSGVMYFAFMAAWLNVFLVTGQLRWVTTVAGCLALVIATLNMKDFFLPGSAGSLVIPESAKPGLFARMRSLTMGSAMPTVLLGTVALAAVANSYELLCTAGFPLVFTRVLTLNELSTPGYYGYLVLYNVVYVIPLLIIVGVFVWTLGSRKLSESEGQFLKLMSGMMMLGLGLVLVVRPSLLENMLAAVGILVTAVLLSFAVLLLRRVRRAGG